VEPHRCSTGHSDFYRGDSFRLAAGHFSTPMSITANTVYVASYQTMIGHWSVN